MIILGLTTGHDASAALFVEGKLVSFCKQERMSRVKQQAGYPLHQECIDETLKAAGVSPDQIDKVSLIRSRLPANCFKKSYRPVWARMRKILRRTIKIFTEMREQGIMDEFEILDKDCMRKHLKVRSDTEINFTNHHYSHILGAFKFTTWQKDALYVCCDASGDGASYAAYYFDGSTLKRLYGGDDYVLRKKFNFAASIGIAYSHVTMALGYRANRHEGKITGLAAFGKPVLGEEIYNSFSIVDDFEIESSFENEPALGQHIREKAKQYSAEDMAASVQYAMEKFVLDWVCALRKEYPCKYIGMSGGVFANVRLNQKIAELDGVENVFIFPAMGDEGLAVGNCVDIEIQEQGAANIKRYKLQDVYMGYDYTGTSLLNIAQQQSFYVQETADGAEVAAELLAKGIIGAIFSERMEMGPRALGARSIVASPSKRELNDTLNERLNRTEFMPFAPYVLDDDAREVFDISDVTYEACRFMTITTDVNEKYHDMIQAVVHVDGTARPQIIERETNALYYDILLHFKNKTGIPCLVNTSFNAHEEPIINKPIEALNSLSEKRIDFLVCDAGLVFRNEQDYRMLLEK